MNNSNIFKFLSISLLMCPWVSAAMNKPVSVEGTIPVSIVNQSDQTIEVWIFKPASSEVETLTVNPRTVVDDNKAIFRNGNTHIITKQGTFVLSRDKVDQPTSLVLSQRKDKRDSQGVVVQTIPYRTLNPIAIFVGPDGSVGLVIKNATRTPSGMLTPGGTKSSSQPNNGNRKMVVDDGNLTAK